MKYVAMCILMLCWVIVTCVCALLIFPLVLLMDTDWFKVPKLLIDKL
jgi:hypothetical protein